MSGGSSSVASTSKDVPPIQAFACLEFDTFTFYIQTLSVTIGRRPPAIHVVEPSGASSGSSSFPPAEKGLPGTIKREPGNGLSPSLTPQFSETRSTSPRLSPAGAPSASAAEHNTNLGSGKNNGTTDELQTDNFSLSGGQHNGEVMSPETAAELEAHRMRQAKAREQASLVDVDLGNIKAVSRDHARVYFDQTLGSWAITVNGRNGVVVDGRWRARGETAPLRKRTRIQIAERIFHFALPATVVQSDGQLAPAPVENETSSSDGEVQVGSDDFESASESEQPLAATTYVPQELYASAPRSPKRKTKKTPAKYHPEDLSPPAPPEPPEPEYELDPIGTTSSRVKLTLKPRHESPETFVTLSGRKSRAAAQKTKANAATNKKKTQQQQNAKNGGKPQQPKVSQLTVQPVAQMEDWFGRPEKPPFSFASLVAQAITQNAPFKLTSAAICEWIAWKYPWFEANKEKVAWQNSVQQNLTVHTIFLKIPRQSDEPGKGNFWLMDPHQTHTFDGHNFTSQPIKAGSAVAQGHDVYAAKERAKAANARDMEEWERRRDEGEDVGPHGGLPGVGMNPPGPTSAIPPTSTTPVPKPPAAADESEHEDDVPPPPTPEPVAQPAKSKKPSATQSPASVPPAASQTQPSPQPVASSSRPTGKSPAATPAQKAKPVKSEKVAQKLPVQPADTNGAAHGGASASAAAPSPATAPLGKTPVATPTPPPPPPAQSSSSSQPSGAAQAPGSAAPIPIVIGPIPDSYIRPTPPPNAPPPKDELSAQLLREPPVILHENKLILSPVIFAHLKPAQIEELSKLGASKAIGVLQAYIVRHFKEKAKKNKKAASGSPSPSPASSATALPTPGTAVAAAGGTPASASNRKRPAAGSPGDPPAKKAAH